MDFPLVKTKTNSKVTYDLNKPIGRAKYFKEKCGKEIEKIKDYFAKGGTFIAYAIAKKAAGKGTYIGLFKEIFGEKYVAHISVGDIIRNVDKKLHEDSKYRMELEENLKPYYRGFVSLQDAIDSIMERSVKITIPTELVLALLKLEIAKHNGKALFIDGFVRSMDQITYALYFRDLVDYREDPDFFMLIDIPLSVIDMRLKYRRVCPVCGNSHNLKLLPSSIVQYDNDKKEFYLICDSSNCKGKNIKMVTKESDELGIEGIKERLETEGKLMEMAYNLYGIPKILLRNHLPVDGAFEYVDKYEVTPAYEYKWNGEKVVISTKPLTFDDDDGIKSYSLLAAPVMVSAIRQMSNILL